MSYPQIYFDLGLLPPGQMKMPRIMAGGVTGGTSASGLVTSSDMSGGGFVAVDYSNIQLGNANQSALRYWNRLAVTLNSGVRPIIVPLLTDFIAPVSSPAGSVLTPFSDTSTFSDTSEFSQAPVSGFVIAPAAINAGTVQISVIGGTGILEGGEWFGLNHPTKSFRAYNVTDIDSVTVDGNGNNIYTVAIRPTLREALAGAEIVDWWRPRCVMRLDPSTPIETDVEKVWYSTPSIKLVEFFGTL